MSFVGFWRPPMTPPPPQTPQYLTILQTERGRALPLVGFWRPPMPPPPPTPQYLTILMTERGAPLSCAGLCPPPLPQTPQYLTLDSERGWVRQYPVRS